MDKVLKQTPLHVKLWFLVILVVGLSEAIVYNGGPPILYCHAWIPFYRTFVSPFASLVLVICCGYWLYAMATDGVISGKSASALLLIFLIANLDGWMRTFLALGKG